MYWLPIVFVCLFNGECGFVQDTAHIYQKECEKALNEMVTRMEQEPAVTSFRGTCLQIDIPTI